MAFDTELNDFKIQADEMMTGANHPSGLEDTLNREANRIYNLIRIENMFPDGSNKIRAYDEKIADAGSSVSPGGTVDLGDFEFTITDEQAIITGTLVTNLGMDDSSGTNSGVNVEIFVDGVQSGGSSELWFDTHGVSGSPGDRVQERTLAKSFSSTLTGSGSHIVEVVWNTLGGGDDIFNVEGGVRIQGLILENQSLA
jgi:hypothetical protein